MDMQEILKAVLETEVEGEAQLDEIAKAAGCSDKGQAAAKGALRILRSFKDELLPEVVAKATEIAGQEAVVEKAAPAMSPEVEAIFKAQATELAEVKKALKAAKDERELADWTQKAATELSHFPGKSTAELGQMLKDLYDLNPEMCTAQFEAMKAASAALATGPLLKSAGETAAPDASSSAWDKIQKLADGLVEKSGLSMTRAQAINKVLAAEPKLYADYLNDNPVQSL